MCLDPGSISTKKKKKREEEEGEEEGEGRGGVRAGDFKENSSTDLISLFISWVRKYALHAIFRSVQEKLSDL